MMLILYKFAWKTATILYSLPLVILYCGTKIRNQNYRKKETRPFPIGFSKKRDARIWRFHLLLNNPDVSSKYWLLITINTCGPSLWEQKSGEPFGSPLLGLYVQRLLYLRSSWRERKEVTVGLEHTRRVAARRSLQSRSPTRGRPLVVHIRD